MQFTRVAPAEATAQWPQVGVVCIAGMETRDPDTVYASEATRRRLGADACWLGGDLVTPVGFCSAENATPGLRNVSAIQFAVFQTGSAYTSKDSPPKPVALQAQPPPPPSPEAACAEAADYQRRASNAEGAVKDALRRIANTKSAECADGKKVPERGATAT